MLCIYIIESLPSSAGKGVILCDSIQVTRFRAWLRLGFDIFPIATSTPRGITRVVTRGNLTQSGPDTWPPDPIRTRHVATRHVSNDVSCGSCFLPRGGGCPMTACHVAASDKSDIAGRLANQSMPRVHGDKKEAAVRRVIQCFQK
ncbi:hypothetical protein Tco_0994093, partial [Tanacetum coccineum]